MKNLTKIKKNIRDEISGKVMHGRIRAKAEWLIKDLEDNISDEVGELMGKLAINFTDEESQNELASYIFDRIREALIGEIKKQLK